jgi:hypothetical protein
LIASFKILKKDLVPGFLDRLLAEREVFAPLRKGRGVAFGKIDSACEAFLEYGNTKESPKFSLFPATGDPFCLSSG